MMVGNRQCGTLWHVNHGVWLVTSTWKFDDKKVTHVKYRKRTTKNPPTVNHVSVLENAISGRQERVNQEDEDVTNHIPVSNNTNSGRQERIDLETNISATPWGRTQLILSATTGIRSTAVEQVARGKDLTEKDKDAQHKNPRSQRIMNQITLTKNTLQVLSTSAQNIWRNTNQ